MMSTRLILTCVIGLSVLLHGASIPSYADVESARFALPQTFAVPMAETPDDKLENQIAVLMRQHADQKRKSLKYNAILAKVARERAFDMGKRNYFSHVNPDGHGPNYLVQKAGYVLPEFYGTAKDSNFIESIGAGAATAAGAWKMWMNSSGHKTHILGLTSFYADQIEYGIGHAFVPGSEYKHYWVVITAKPGP